MMHEICLLAPTWRPRCGGGQSGPRVFVCFSPLHRCNWCRWNGPLLPGVASLAQTKVSWDSAAPPPATDPPVNKHMWSRLPGREGPFCFTRRWAWASRKLSVVKSARREARAVLLLRNVNTKSWPQIWVKRWRGGWAVRWLCCHFRPNRAHKNRTNITLIVYLPLIIHSLQLFQSLINLKLAQILLLR